MEYVSMGSHHVFMVIMVWRMFEWQPLWSTTMAVVASLISLDGGLSGHFYTMEVQ
jgi:hypothetical protein